MATLNTYVHLALTTYSSEILLKVELDCIESIKAQTKLPFKAHWDGHKTNIKNGDIKHSSITYHCWFNSYNFNFSKGAKIQKFSSICDHDFWQLIIYGRILTDWICPLNPIFPNSDLHFFNSLYSLPLFPSFLLKFFQTD